MIRVAGMMGLGDCIHQRAILRQLMLRDRVSLETCWPSVYHDMVGPRLELTRRHSGMRTQAKNEAREAAKFAPGHGDGHDLRIWYTHDEIRRHGTFLAAMAANCGMTVAPGDFALPIPDEWTRRAQVWIYRWRPDRPLMMYRPLVERSEWGSCATRNPDHEAYAALARAVRERYFVVSVADLAPGKEWQAGVDIKADVECHAGELEVEVLAALFAKAGLVFCSPGFAIILAQAVGTPLVAVFGGHEIASFYAHGSPRCHFVQPVNPCACFRGGHDCDKRIDMPRALSGLQEFTETACVSD